ncbi:unnamed protein product [Ambrosiozyma monospora]|uniref:Unnamed protein product n=1 Tax=Ambrosiozyma monospora TaxID=43982 RepID=A0ACB5TYJ6_AMBMO|nr:unnamed protein product [Ambrosiozyma monospora]
MAFGTTSNIDEAPTPENTDSYNSSLIHSSMSGSSSPIDSVLANSPINPDNLNHDELKFVIQELEKERAKLQQKLEQQKFEFETELEGSYDSIRNN